MVNILLLLLFNSLYIQGLFRSSWFEWKSNFVYKPTKNNMKLENIDTQFNMILWFVRYYSLKYIGNKWSKPIITCPTCMASVHSTYFYFAFIYLTNQYNPLNAILYIPYVFALAGLNAVITSLIDRD